MSTPKNKLLNGLTANQQIKKQAYEYKGFVAENFVQQELAVLGLEPTYAWTDTRVEIEFLLTDNLGNIVPVEVKSGTRTRARSLASYVQRYNPVKTVKLSAMPSQTHNTGATALNLPLYDVALLPGLLG
jgi:hypothetical protein